MRCRYMGVTVRSRFLYSHSSSSHLQRHVAAENIIEFLEKLHTVVERELIDLSLSSSCLQLKQFSKTSIISAYSELLIQGLNKKVDADHGIGSTSMED